MTMNYSLDTNCGETLYALFKFEFWILRVAVVTLLIASVLFGNILILTSIVKYRRHYKGFMFELIGHLAVVDIVLSFGLLIHILGYASTFVQMSHVLCVVKIVCVTTSVICSSKILLLMSVDRFLAIVYPLKHLIKSSEDVVKRRVILVFIWTVSLSVSSFTGTRVYNFAKSSANFTCLYVDMLPSEFSLLSSSYIIVQFFVCVILSIIAIKKLKTNNMSKFRFKKSATKYRLLLRIICLYIICWSPYIVTSFLLETTRNGGENHTLNCIRSYSVIFGCLHSGTNWIINGVANKRFRHVFISILKCQEEESGNLTAIQSERTINTLNNICSESQTRSSFNN